MTSPAWSIRAAIRDGVAEELVDTGMQRLLGDLDELPDPVLGYRLLEAAEPLGHAGSQPRAAPSRVRKLSPISSLVLTFGCKFACPYCPIPAYNQRQHRAQKRRAHRRGDVAAEQGVRPALFLRRRRQLLQQQGAHAGDRRDAGAAPSLTACRCAAQVRWHTEVTVHDTLQMKEHLPLIRESGCRACGSAWRT